MALLPGFAQFLGINFGIEKNGVPTYVADIIKAYGTWRGMEVIFVSAPFSSG
jgi:hypothetical protein